jgi:hypothetical protein
LTAVLAPSAADVGRGNGHFDCNLEFMYHEDGKCLNARDKPSDFWVFQTRNAGDFVIKKSKPCDGLDPGLCEKE